MDAMRRPPNYSEDQFLEVWHLWGVSSKLWDIAQILNINSDSIHGILNKYGGIAPYRRKRRDGHLNNQERERIMRRMGVKQSYHR